MTTEPAPGRPDTADTAAYLIGSPDYPDWRTAVIRATMGVGPVPSLPAVLPLAELVDEAVATRGTQPITHAGDRPRPTPRSRALADLDRMLALGDAGIGGLGGWVRHIAAERAADRIDDQWPDDNLPAVAEWLHSRLDWCATQPWWGDLAADIARMHGALRHICRITPRPTWTCTVPGCGEVAEEMPGSEWMLCRAGHQLQGTAVMRRQVASRWLTAREVREVHGIPEGTVWRWRHLGWIAPMGSKGGALLWSEWDLLSVRHTIAMGDTPRQVADPEATA